jgi:hypothetical protein
MRVAQQGMADHVDGYAVLQRYRGNDRGVLGGRVAIEPALALLMKISASRPSANREMVAR